jgi:hypothetical protein
MNRKTSTGAGTLTKKQLKFVAAWQGDVVAAARAAGYSKPESMGYRIMEDPAVANEIRRKQKNHDRRISQTPRWTTQLRSCPCSQPPLGDRPGSTCAIASNISACHCPNRPKPRGRCEEREAMKTMDATTVMTHFGNQALPPEAPPFVLIGRYSASYKLRTGQYRHIWPNGIRKKDKNMLPFAFYR